MAASDHLCEDAQSHKRWQEHKSLQDNQPDTWRVLPPCGGHHFKYGHGTQPTTRKSAAMTSKVLLAALVATLIPSTVAQQGCVSLAGSTTCPAFNASSISPSLTNLFPFLSNVTDVRSFDNQLAQYVNTTYAQQKYQSQNFFGCSNVNLSNPTDLYARYTYSFICNAIIQNSISTCALSPQDSAPLCADSCADFAESEENIISSPQLCGSTGNNAIDQLRADFTNCAQPQDALNSTCIPGYQNEPQNCGFQSNIVGLCSFCSTSSVNSTDSCCVTSQSEQRCDNVRLPVYNSMTPVFSSTPSSTPTASSTAVAANTTNAGLTGGQIAGIVVGAVVGAAVLLALLICCCLLLRRRRSATDAKSSLNQPTPPQSREKAARTSGGAASGARVTRMAALEHDSNDSPPDQTGAANPAQSQSRAPAAAGVIGRRGGKSDSEGVEDSSPESQGYSSGEGATTGQSEQLDAFKDYYSNEDIHPGDHVSTLWAYSPRANDEFELERGDMLKVVGIWDDGWATGIRTSQRADQWESEHNTQRDSGMSGGTGNEASPRNGEVKAFPLVCVCLPQHWRKTVEGDVTEPDFSSDGPTTD